MKFLKSAFSFCASYGVAVVLLLLMLLLTFLGTLNQVEEGLYLTQKKYFESLYVVHDLYGIPLLLPGGLVVMSLFTLNLICGGILRIRKNWKTPGILISHLGILVLLFGGLVSFQYSDAGAMTLYERQSSDEFTSYYEWNLEIHKAGSNEILIIPEDDFADLRGDASRRFQKDELPFDVVVSGFSRNAVPMKVGPAIANQVRAVDGYFLQTLERNPTAEQNVPGCYVTVVDKATGAEQEVIAWGMAVEPATVTAGGEKWTIDLHRKRWQVPFTVVLDDFRVDFHPGTSMAESFESDITKIEGSTTEKIRIYMNNPLRHEGYTFFQSGWGPPDAAPGEPLFSTFSVVRNPADHWPLYSCIIISFGLLVHFTQKLARYIRRENQRRYA